MPLLLTMDDLDEPADPPDQTFLHDDDDLVLCDEFVEDDEDEEFVECDPSGRYGRYPELLGRGSSKIVYRAYDRVDCKEVAWNQVKLSASQEQAVQREVRLLRGLEKHKGVIKLLADWVDTENGNIIFITELCSATLLEYRMKHKHASRKAVKSWGRQILMALAHLHSQSPPVVHRDLKCSNIFVKSSANCTLKLGDFGLAATVDESKHRLNAVVGTPEFMAPELFEEEYDELVDVYSFGMCMLELLTREVPYSECKCVAQIYKKVTSGVKPRSLSKVKDALALRFITRCLLPASQRPSANDLLADPFLAECSESMTWGFITPVKKPFHEPIFATGSSCQPTAREATLVVEASDQLGDFLRVKTVLDARPPTFVGADIRSLASQESFRARESRCAPVVSGGEKDSKNFKHMPQCRVTGKREDENTVRLKLRIQQSCRARDICFPFDLRHDSPRSVAEEMVRVLQYPDADVVTIADLIGAEIADLAAAKPVCAAPPSILRHASSESELLSPKFFAAKPQPPEMEISEPAIVDSQPRQFKLHPNFAPGIQEPYCDSAPIFRSCTEPKDLRPSSVATSSGVNQLFTGGDTLFGLCNPQTSQSLLCYSKVLA